MKNQLTVVFTTHRPEMVPITADLMKSHDIVFLEEPPTPEFIEMLEGRLSIDDYLAPLDVEYPEFSKHMCHLERDLHARGIRVLQVEPFLEELTAIHEFFADGYSPEAIDRHSLRYVVYNSERNASGALLAYYRTVMTGNFDESIAAIIAFAKQDAARFRLRDKLRSIAIANRADKNSRCYVEAGVIHYYLYQLLKKELAGKIPVRLIFAEKQAVQQIGASGHIYGPGDQLTLLYIHHPRLNAISHRESLLAARSLIHAKLIMKDEINDPLAHFPHLRNELETISLANSLSINDCRALFPKIRRSSTTAAVDIVRQYLAHTR